MKNENIDERPRFDSLTGLAIIYDDEPIIQSSEEQTPIDYTNQDTESTDEDIDKSLAATQENISSQYRYTNSEIPYHSTTGNTSEADNNNLFFTTDTKTSESDKASQKSTKKATKNINKNGKGFRKVIKLVAASVMCGIIAGSTMYGVYYTGVSYFPTSVSNSSNKEIATVNTSNLSDALISEASDSTATMNVPNVVKAAMPAVVAISGTVTTNSSSYYNPFNSGTSEAGTSGTGIIIGKNDTELFMVTNAHVVDGVNNLTVTFIDEESVSATVKGSKSDKDIAVVAINISDLKDSTIESIAIAELGDSDKIQVGESVVAIGNALGEGQSVTVGWVSALDRSITIDSTEYSNLIMTDAAINPGNSGGALLNASGEVIGINSAKYASEEVEGMGYAIPISSVKDIIDNLVTKQTRAKVADSQASYFGVYYGMDVTSTISSSYNVPKGVMISQVAEGSPAEKAGLAKSDIIVSFAGEDITSFTGLQSTMQYYASGEKVTVCYYHFNEDDKTYEYIEAEVTLASLTSK